MTTTTETAVGLPRCELETRFHSELKGVIRDITPGQTEDSVVLSGLEGAREVRLDGTAVCTIDLPRVGKTIYSALRVPESNIMFLSQYDPDPPASPGEDPPPVGDSLFCNAPECKPKDSKAQYEHLAKWILKDACRLALTPNGQVSVLDRLTKCVHTFNSKGMMKDTLDLAAVDGVSPDYPRYIAYNNGGRKEVAYSDGMGNCVYIFVAGVLTATCGTPGMKGKEQHQLWFPNGVAWDPRGRLLVADGLNNRVQAFSPDGTCLGTVVDEAIFLGEVPPTGPYDNGPLSLHLTTTGRLLVGGQDGEVKVFAYSG